MVRKIIVGYRPGRHGEDALALARLLTTFAPVEEVLVVAAVRAADIGRAGRGLDVTQQDWPPHIRVTARAIADGSAPDALISVVETEEADLLVLGATHRGFAGRVLRGTTAGSLLKASGCMVSIAPTGFSESDAALHRIGVAVDGSDGSRAALTWAAGLASSCSASLRLIGVVEPPPPTETWGYGVPPETWASGLTFTAASDLAELAHDRMQRELTAAAASVGRADADKVTVIGNVAHELHDAAHDLDMLVVGSHSGGQLASAVLGSVSRALLHSCPAPLTVVPLRGDREPDATAAQAAGR